MKKINARNKGNSYERALAKELREWFPDCKTSRYTSKYVDDVMKTDFTGTPGWNLQAKAVERGMNAFKVLSEMPDDKLSFNVILHKRNRQGELAIMSKQDFYAILDYFKRFGLIT